MYRSGSLYITNINCIWRVVAAFHLWATKVKCFNFIIMAIKEYNPADNFGIDIKDLCDAPFIFRTSFFKTILRKTPRCQREAILAICYYANYHKELQGIKPASRDGLDIIYSEIDAYQSRQKTKRNHPSDTEKKFTEIPKNSQETCKNSQETSKNSQIFENSFLQHTENEIINTPRDATTNTISNTISSTISYCISDEQKNNEENFEEPVIIENYEQRRNQPNAGNGNQPAIPRIKKFSEPWTAEELAAINEAGHQLAINDPFSNH